MNDDFITFILMKTKELENYSINNLDKIHEMIDLGDFHLIGIKEDHKYEDSFNWNISNVNVAVAAAITAYSRIHMSHFQNNNKIKLFYSDTDSIYISGNLPENMVSKNEIGKMKLEKTLKKVCFIAPKVYALLDINNIQTIKVKGLKKENTLSLLDLQSLLFTNNTLIFEQNRWFRYINLGNIKIKDIKYNLKFY